ncbi:MAG: TonB-dependent receptor, partial [Bacteroidia bacterium]
SIKASYAKMQQSVHLLSSSGVGLPTDLWLPATKKVRPSTSVQYALGIAQSIEHGLYEFSIETFYKKMNNLIEYRAGADIFSSTSDWQNAVEKNGIGLSYGAEFLLQKKQGNNTGWIGYTLSKTTRQFENLNKGKPFNYRYDRRHDISVVYLRKINENIDFSATWVFGTGNAFTLAIARYNVLSENGIYENIHVYEGINTFRMRPYHKMDIGFNFRKQKKRGIRTWNVSIYNLYNRQNPYYYYFENNLDNVVLKQVSLFPIMPSASYSFNF